MAHAGCRMLQGADSAVATAGLARLYGATRGDRPPARAATEQADTADVRRCLDGDQEAFRRLVERHQGRVASLMWRFSRDHETHAELVQDVFVEAWRSLPGYRAEAPFVHWLSRIATRVGYRFWRRRARDQRIRTVPLEDCPELSAPEQLEPSEAGELLHRLLAELSPRDRLVITLRYVEELSVEETAELTGWSRAMVKVQAWRARGRLLKLFGRATGVADDER